METHRGRGLVLEYTSNFEEAVTEFEAVMEINPNIATCTLAWVEIISMSRPTMMPLQNTGARTR